MKTKLSGLMLALVIMLVVSGCSKKADQPDLDSLTSESILGEDTQYGYLQQVLGGMSSRDMFDMLDNMMQNMNAAMRAGDATSEDYRNLVQVLTNVRDWMAGTEPKTAAEEAAGSAGLKVLDMMVKNSVGDLMTRSVRAAGPDILTENVFPMMAYVMACDDQIVKDAVNGITINDLGFDTRKLTNENFSAMVNATHGFLNKEDTDYKAIRDKWDALDDAIDANGLDITVGDVKDALPDMDLEDLDNLPVYIDTMSALHKLYDEDPKIKEDLDKVMYAAGALMNDTKRTADGHNSWDKAGITDMERMLFCLNNILKPEGRDKLNAFLVRLLDGIDYVDGADNIYGIMNALAGVYNLRNPYTNNIPDLNQIDHSIYRNMFQMNQDYETTEYGDTKVSLMRSIFMLFDVMCVLSDTLDGAPTRAITALISDEEPYIKDEYKSNILEYIVNLWGQACYHYPESFHGSYAIDEEGENRPYPDPLQGTDWLFFTEKISYAGIPTNGLAFILNFVDIIGVPDYVMGVLTESMPSIVCFTGSFNEKYTTGHNQRMMTVGGPLIHYYGEIGYGSALIHIIGYMNELSMPNYKTMAWYGSNATYRQDNLGTAFETIEGPYGYGLLYYLMRGASDAKPLPDGSNKIADTADIVDPVMDLVVRVLYTLSTIPYEDSNLLRHLCDILTSHDFNPDNKTHQQLIDDLLEDDGLVDNLYRFISPNDNHAALSQVCAALGDVVLAAINPENPNQDVLYSDDVAGLLKTSVLPKLGTGLKSNRNAVATLVSNAILQADPEATAVSAAAGELAATVCDKGVRITDDLALAVPGLDEIYEASTVDYDYDSAASKLQPFIDYLVDDVNGQENPLVFNLKALGYKLTGIYDETYNTRASALKVDDNTPVMDVVNHVVGDSGIYKTTPITGFLFELTGDNGDTLWRLIDADETYNLLDLHWLEKIFGDDLDDMLSWAFVRSMCISYNGNDPVMLMVFKTIHLADSEDQVIEFNGVLSDLYKFFDNQEFQPGTRLFDGIYNALQVVVNSWS